ncbi:MAG: sulfite oxidase [Chloroflexi bacterium]|nr:sulfite oxidase [Chloroflexota bacterium]
MPLFVVQHKHSADTCPAGHPQMGPMLLQHLSKGNAAKSGIMVRGEAVVDGQHTLYLILEAAGADKIREFMTPFAQMGSVEVLPASLCESVVKRGRC